MSGFTKGQIVETTRKVPFGKNSHIPKNVRGKVVRVEGFLTKKYSVEFFHNQYGKVVITTGAGYFRGTYSF